MSASIRSVRRRQYPKRGGGINVGNRCKEYAPGCPVCESWRFLDLHGRFPYNYDELSLFIEQTVKYDDF